MRLRTFALAAVACGLLVACGPDPQSEPRSIDPSTVPFGLLERRSNDQTPAGRETLVLYFVGTDRLVAVDHPETDAIDAGTALRRLLDGPTEPELQRGLGTSLPSPRAARFVDTDGGVARVELAENFRDGTIPSQATALAQIVFTLTDVPGTERVSFVVDGHVAAVPRGDGSLTRSPVGREDYATFAPQQQP